MTAAPSCTLLVLAKAPWTGRVKTRLCPPCRPDQAARLAGAALTDTFLAVAAAGGPRCRRVLVLDGAMEGTGVTVPDGFEVLRQRGDGLDQRLAAAFADGAAGGAALLVGMDTPQVQPDLLDRALATLLHPGTDAVMGAAADGGWWAAGLRRPDPAAFLGVPMSTPHTGAAQRRRFRELGLVMAELPVLRDVDHIGDAVAVAAECPAGSHFAREMSALRGEAATADGRGSEAWR